MTPFVGWEGPDAFPWLNTVALLGTRNAILSGTSVPYVVTSFTGPLSIKWMPAGWGVWETNHGRYRVDPHCYLILNHGQKYALTIDRGEPRESFCLFFGSGFVEHAHRALTTANDLQLDDPQQPGADLHFAEQLYQTDARVIPLLQQMHDAWREGRATHTWLEEQFHYAAEALLWARADHRRRVANVPAARPGTRAELARRLHRARDFMHTHFDQALSLSAVARVACLSPHHFHRLFRTFFGLTPHNYLTTLRLERAKTLLRSTELSVTEICLESGFESLGSFSTLFRRAAGMSPTRFRQAAGRN